MVCLRLLLHPARSRGTVSGLVLLFLLEEADEVGKGPAKVGALARGHQALPDPTRK